MSRYVNIEPYNDCKIVLYKEDVGIRCRELLTADVAEVKHGRWEVTKHKNHIIVTCSCCGKEFYVYIQGQYRVEQSNYCPNCGARMDGVKI